MGGLLEVAGARGGSGRWWGRLTDGAVAVGVAAVELKRELPEGDEQRGLDGGCEGVDRG